MKIKFTLKSKYQHECAVSIVNICKILADAASTRSDQLYSVDADYADGCFTIQGERRVVQTLAYSLFKDLENFRIEPDEYITDNYKLLWYEDEEKYITGRATIDEAIKWLKPMSEAEKLKYWVNVSAFRPVSSAMDYILSGKDLGNMSGMYSATEINLAESIIQRLFY